MPVTIFAIESSCDETSAAVCRDGKILSNIIANQTVHEKYGGVVPELASRAHMQHIVPVVDAALKQEGTELTGTVNSMMGSGPVKNAVIGNPDVTFQFMIGKYTFDVKAIAEGDLIRGNFTGPRMKGGFLAKRNEAPAGPVVTPVEGVEVGVLGAAQYRIDIPKNFNGSLLIYCH